MRQMRIRTQSAALTCIRGHASWFGLDDQVLTALRLLVSWGLFSRDR
jgi:hypothetical protein